MATRPIEITEYKEVIRLCQEGFIFHEEGKERTFRPNQQLSMVLQLQVNLGLRIGDILELTLSNFRNGKLERREQKTGKLQFADLNTNLLNLVMSYALNNNIPKDGKLFSIGVRAVQKQLKIICDYLQLTNISTHSFRKLFATMQYEANNNDLELVKELLNHSSIATTQRYIRVSQEAINKARKDFYIE